MGQKFTYTQLVFGSIAFKLFNKELQSVLEWVASNKLVLNISKTKIIVLGTRIP